MHTNLSTHKQAVFATLLATFAAPTSTPVTLADLDRQQDFSELEQLVAKLAGPHCLSIEFHDDNRKHGCRSLEWIVVTSCYNGYADRDEDGNYADTGNVREVIWVPVRDTDTIENIAERVVAEVRGIDSNVFA
ncbi:hypothetical protein [Spirosoma endbachense]|uniref:Uncharacterized protein n=1 Tax=Spirosoma endbachense TaxID=2666025 RepID=A0A6P1VWX0_9BACT|nr:hypothetical protein [Spirosoma endbachense]QHV96330.1 hypothetical protein GJR95_15455 [Spirosoma endbachense]